MLFPKFPLGFATFGNIDSKVFSLPDEAVSHGNGVTVPCPNIFNWVTNTKWVAQWKRDERRNFNALELRLLRIEPPKIVCELE